MQKPRTLHLQHPRGFTDQDFDVFRAHCAIWQAYATEVLRQWPHLPLGGKGQSGPQYQIAEPQLSPDRTVASLPIDGEQTLGSRGWLEDQASRLLWQFFPLEFLKDLEEGVTEDIGTGEVTHWRKALRR